MDSKQFDSKQLLNELLQAVKVAAEKGQVIAEDKLNIPESGKERDAAIGGLKKGAAVAGVLAVLLGTRTGRALTGTAVKLGSVAALGTVAYKAFQNWQGKQSTAESVNDLHGKAAHQRGLLIFSAMVAAANADGHINQAEQSKLKEQLLGIKLPEKLLEQIEAIIATPPTNQDIIRQVKSETEAAEVYLATRIFIHKYSSQQEQQYMQQLIEGLGISADLLVELDKQLELKQ